MNDKFSSSWLGVKLDKYELLPRAMDEVTVMNWDREAWPKDACPNMGPAIIIMPRFVMIVRHVLRCESFKCPWDIFQ